MGKVWDSQELGVIPYRKQTYQSNINYEWVPQKANEDAQECDRPWRLKTPTGEQKMGNISGKGSKDQGGDDGQWAKETSYGYILFWQVSAS